MMEKDLGRKCGIMDEISAIRNAWNYQAPEAFIKKIMEGSPYASHHQYKMLSGEIPSGLKNKFSDDMLGRMKDFVTELKSRLH